MDRFTPLVEIGLGTLPLLATLFIHGSGMYFIQWRFANRRPEILSSRFGSDVFFGAMIVVMVFTHLIEIIVWAATLALVDAIPAYRDAFYYAAGTYTTLGYGEGTLPPAWRLLGPMIAISGLFAFGWTTGLLVNIVSIVFRERLTAAAKPPAS
jgi:Ion channel